MSEQALVEGLGDRDLERIEAVLAGARYAAEVALVALPSPRGDAELVAFVVPEREALASEGVLDGEGLVRFHMRERAAALPHADRPGRVLVLADPLPRDEGGALARARLSELARKTPARGRLVAAFEGGVEARGRESLARVERAADPLDADSPSRVLASLLRERACHPGRVQPDAELNLDLGLDSLERVALLAELEERLGLDLPDEALLARRVEEWRQHVRAAAPSGAGERRDRLAPDEASSALLARARRVSRLGTPLLRGVLGTMRRRLRRRLDLRISGLERLPLEPPFLLCANHLSDLDGFVLGALLPLPLIRRTWALGKSQLFVSPLVRALLFTARILPTDNLRDFAPALRVARLALEEGEGVMIFPEGQRALDGRMGSWRAGAGVLAASTGAPLVPIAIAGSERVLPAGAKGLSYRDESGRPRTLHLRIAPPIRPHLPAAARRPEQVIAEGRALVAALRDAVERELLEVPEELRVKGVA